MAWIAVALALLFGLATADHPAHPPADPSSTALTVSNLSANSSTLPLYEKFELTFDVNGGTFTNPQFPYDPSPPPGLPGRGGISVEGLFLAPDQSDWSTAFRQPGFLYQDYQRQQIGGGEWLYPQGQPVWKVRFAPKQQGSWQYKLRVQDASICPSDLAPCPNWVETDPASFSVGAPAAGNHGFVQVSPNDPRYFVFSDGTTFPGLGSNMRIDTNKFTYDVDRQFSQYQANGANFFRVWTTQSNIAGSSWNQWTRFNGHWYGGYMPDPGLQNAPEGSGHDFTYKLTAEQPCVFNGWIQGAVAVKPGTTYRFAVTAQVSGVTGPRVSGRPFGFAVKYGYWPANNSCPDGTATYPSLIPDTLDTDWTTLTGTLTTEPSEYFLRNIFLELDNATGGEANVSEISLRELLPDGGLGPEVLVKSKSDEHYDFNPLRSWDWDYILDQAQAKGIYLKLVMLEKNDRVWNRINPDGTLGNSDSNNQNFYASDGTKVRRLHEYFWRYIAARWGYSTAVHSWELLNEGDPFNGNHYEQAEAFGRFIHANTSGRQMVTTSLWHSFPASQFWDNPAYPDVDYADLHAYAGTKVPPTDPHDAAGFHLNVSQWVRDFGISKPTVRGETGIGGTGGENPELSRDRYGVWLHNFTWSQLDPGGMYELYWYPENVERNDLYFQYKPFRDFMEGIPLGDGRYSDAQAVTSDDNTRAVGQRDSLGERAHLWIQNRNHTWWNVVKGVAWGRLSGTVTLPGFTPNEPYPVEYWLFDDPGNLTTQQATLTADGSGQLVLDLSALPDAVTDLAVKIGDYGKP